MYSNRTGTEDIVQMYADTFRNVKYAQLAGGMSGMECEAFVKVISVTNPVRTGFFRPFVPAKIEVEFANGKRIFVIVDIVSKITTDISFNKHENCDVVFRFSEYGPDVARNFIATQTGNFAKDTRHYLVSEFPNGAEGGIGGIIIRELNNVQAMDGMQRFAQKKAEAQKEAERAAAIARMKAKEYEEKKRAEEAHIAQANAMSDADFDRLFRG